MLFEADCQRHNTAAEKPRDREVLGAAGRVAYRSPILCPMGQTAYGQFFDGKVILVTGGTGSFGTKFVETILDRFNPDVIRIFSRDELKQSELQAQYAGESRLRFLLGDVRSTERLRMATRGVDLIVHAAALKQVPACEYNPFEAVQTNIVGAQNVIDSGDPQAASH